MKVTCLISSKEVLPVKPYNNEEPNKINPENLTLLEKPYAEKLKLMEKP